MEVARREDLLRTPETVSEEEEQVRVATEEEVPAEEEEEVEGEVWEGEG